MRDLLLSLLAPGALVAFWCWVIAHTTKPRTIRDARAGALARTLGDGR